MKETTAMNETATTTPRRPHKNAMNQAFPGLTNHSDELQSAQRGVVQAVAIRRPQPNTDAVIRLLNEMLETTVIRILRYKRRQRITTESRSRRVKAMLLQRVTDAQAHADQLAERIVRLGGTALLPFDRVQNRGHEEQLKEDSQAERITAKLLAERSATCNPRKLITSVGPDDPTTGQLFEQVLTEEEAYAENLTSALKD